ncbi:MAG: DHH family phosphoesterase [Bacteroidales bacterium]|nr:DHH family phosphoesterase [Bacteroidales bacterium]
MVSIGINEAAAFQKAVSKAENICLVTHMHPDGDALGSSLGLMNWFHESGLRARVVLPDSEPESIAFMAEGTEPGTVIRADLNMAEALDAISSADLLICLDMNVFNRAEPLTEALEATLCPRILIDHHIGPDESLFQIVMSRPEISSTSELVFWLLMSLPGTGGDARRLPRFCADSLMTGMTTDTNNFSNSAIPSTFSMASMLIDAGVDRDAIVTRINNRYREERVRLMGHMLGNLMEITDEGVAFMVLDKATQDRFGIREGETEGFVNIPLTIDKVGISMLLKEDTDRFRVSIRSKKGLSARRLAMEWFNGGGHEQAAGGKLPKALVPDAEGVTQYVRNAVRKFMENEN